MRKEKDVLKQLKDWAEKIDNIRALVLTSSRADKHRTPDILSDYDVEVYVRDTNPFTQNGNWINEFGSIMVRWPSKPQATSDENRITQLVLFDDGVRIDFQITSRLPKTSPNLECGYKVIIDKDNIVQDMPDPSYYYINPPGIEEYNSRMEAFWWDIVYAAKALKRGELNYAKIMLDGGIRFEKLLPVINWHIGMQNNWSVSTGIYGRWLHKYLDNAAWKEYEKTFSGPDIESNWKALFATIDFFRKLGRKLAKELKFEYPENTDKKVTNYIKKIKNMKDIK